MPFWKNLFPSVKAQEAQAQEDADEEELVDQKTKLQVNKFKEMNFIY